MENLGDILVPHLTGLTPPDRDLLAVMGKEEFGAFLTQREEEFYAYR